MLIAYQYYRKFIFFIIIPLAFLKCEEQYNSKWGVIFIENESSSIHNEEIIKIANEQHEYLIREFEEVNINPLKIIITNSNNIRSNIWKWSLGITKGNKIIIKDPAIAHITKSKFIKVLRHELNHLYLNRISNKKINIPRWFEEGFAMRYASENSLRHKLIIASNMNSNELYDLNTINQKFHSNSKRTFNFAYAYSSLLVNNIPKFYSKNAINQILKNIKTGNSFDEAFYLSTFSSIEHYNKKIYNLITSKYKWFNLIQFPNFLLVLTPLLLIIGFIYKRIKNKKIIKKWELEEELLNSEIDNHEEE